MGGKGQLEKRVNRHPARIDGRDARRGQHHHALGALGLQSAQEGGFTRTGLAGEEQVGACVFYELPRQGELGILLHK